MQTGSKRVDAKIYQLIQSIGILVTNLGPVVCDQMNYSPRYPTRLFLGPLWEQGV